MPELNRNTRFFLFWMNRCTKLLRWSLAYSTSELESYVRRLMRMFSVSMLLSSVFSGSVLLNRKFLFMYVSMRTMVMAFTLMSSFEKQKTSLVLKVRHATFQS